MITPICFDTIGYQTYIIFAVINFFIVPCVYFFYVSQHPSTHIKDVQYTNDLHSPKPHTGLSKKWTRFSIIQRQSGTWWKSPTTLHAATARTANFSSATWIRRKLLAIRTHADNPALPLRLVERLVRIDMSSHHKRRWESVTMRDLDLPQALGVRSINEQTMN